MTYTQTAFQRAKEKGQTTARTEAEFRQNTRQSIGIGADEKLRSLIAFVFLDGDQKSLLNLFDEYVEEVRKQERLRIEERLKAIADSGQIKEKIIGTECKGLLRDLAKDLREE